MVLKITASTPLPNKAAAVRPKRFGMTVWVVKYVVQQKVSIGLMAVMRTRQRIAGHMKLQWSELQGLIPPQQRTAIAAVFGGLAAEATGGSFEDGAMSAAFTHLFNTEPEWWLQEHPGYQSTNSH